MAGTRVPVVQVRLKSSVRVLCFGKADHDSESDLVNDATGMEHRKPAIS